MTIYYVTGNAGKFAEAQRFIHEHAPHITLEQYDVDLTERQTLDQKAIALEKAQQAYDILKKPVLIDDGGMFFDAYNNFPGTLSKFVFEGIGYEGLLKLVEDNNRAHFRLFMVYQDSPDHAKIFEGRCNGIIIRPDNFDAHPHLPYDAFFKPDGTDKTYAQLRGTKEEHVYAYRLRALKKFVDWYARRA